MLRPSSLFVGIDLGTSGIRVGAVDQHDRPVAVISRRWLARQAWNPSAWLHSALHLMGLIRRKAPRARLAALAVDGTSGSVFLCNSVTGRPLTPVLPYNDNRAAREAETVAAEGLMLGSAAGPYGGPAKALWLERHCAPRDPYHITAQGPWLTGALLGDFRYSDEHNALRLGFDERWHEALSRLHLQDKLPRVVPSGRVLGHVSPGIARRLQVDPPPLVVAGTTDSTASFLALGPLPFGTGVTSLGSTLVLKIVSPQRISVPDYGIYSHRVDGKWLVGGASNSGAAVLAHYFDEETLARLSTMIPTGSPTGLDYYPLLSPGERFPINDPHLAPRLAPRPRDDQIFLQGLLEGLAAIEARGYQRLRQSGGPPLKRIVTTGGGARNSAWRALREQAVGVPITNRVAPQAALGAARLARAAQKEGR